MHRSILLHPLWRLTQLAALPFAHRAQHRTVNITLGSNMICIQTSERLFWRAHNSNRLFSYFRFSPRNICSVFEQYAIVWDATWSSRQTTPISETLGLYWPVTEEYTKCESSGYRWWGIASFHLQIYPAQEYLPVPNYVVKPGSHFRGPNVKLPTTTAVSRDKLKLRWAGHIVRMQDNLPCKKITLDKSEGRRRAGRPNLRWMDGVMRDAQRLGARNCGGLRPGTEMVGGVFLSRPRPYKGCSAWEWVECEFYCNTYVSHKRVSHAVKSDRLLRIWVMCSAQPHPHIYIFPPTQPNSDR